jgi:ComF family protein
MNLSKFVRNIAMQAVDAVLPSRCIVTGDVVPSPGMLAPKAWAGIDFIAKPFCGVCGFPFDFSAEMESLCGSCLADKPPFETARAAVKYNDSSRPVILGFKHGDQIHAVTAFLPWLKRSGAEMLAEADFLAPVPLHKRRLIRRRYNQAAIIAFALGKDMMLSTLPDILIRTRHTPSQGHLRAQERFKNVKKAFSFNEKYKADIKGKTIVLIDDVYTTGATVMECTDVLMKHGAGRVHVLTLARVAKPGFVL